MVFRHTVQCICRCQVRWIETSCCTVDVPPSPIHNSPESFDSTTESRALISLTFLPDSSPFRITEMDQAFERLHIIETDWPFLVMERPIIVAMTSTLCSHVYKARSVATSADNSLAHTHFYSHIPTIMTT